MAKLIIWASSMESEGLPFFCMRRKTELAPKRIPDKTAIISPSSESEPILFLKKIKRPAKTQTSAPHCSQRGFSFIRNQPRRAAQAGALYWSRMALAEEVSLFATTKLSMVRA